MGLQDFYLAVRELYPQTTTLLKAPNFEGVTKEYDHVLYDMNNALYLLASTSKTDKVLIRRVFFYVLSILQKFPPKKSVYIALDGPGPMAKILLQRERRQDASRPELTARFTPGTEFMTLLKHSLLVYVSYLATLPQYHHVKFFVSGADREGEGEFKIFEHMRTMSAAAPTDNAGNFIKGDKCLVVGNDSDLIVMGMNQKIFSVDLLRCEQLGLWKHYNLDFLKERLCHGLLGDRELIVRDFMVLCLLNGGDYLPKCATFKFKSCWVNYCRLKKREENKERNIVSSMADKSDTQALDLTFLAEVVKVSALKESHHEVVWLDRKGKPGFKMSKESPLSALAMLSQIIFGHPPVFEQREIGTSMFEAKALIATHPAKQRISVNSEKKFEEGSICIEISSAVGSYWKEAVRKASIQALEKNSPFLKEVEKRLSGRDYEQIVELLTGQTWSLDELIKSEPKEEMRVSASVPPAKAQIAVEYLAMIVWVANYWTSHCLSYNYFFPYIFGPSVYDLLALAENPNHPALTKKGNNVSLPVKVNEFGQGTQVSRLPEVGLRVPDAVSNIGMMTPLMFCAAISSKKLFSSIVPKPFAELEVGCKVLTPHVNTKQKTIYFDNLVKEFNEEVARIIEEHGKTNKDLEENYVKFQPSLLVYNHQKKHDPYNVKTKDITDSAHISDSDITVVSETFPNFFDRIRRYKHNLVCLSEDKLVATKENQLVSEPKPRLYKTPNSFFNKSTFSQQSPMRVDLLQSKKPKTATRQIIGQVKTFVTVMRRFIK